MFEKIKKNNIKIAIIGLGYVGLPLLEEFTKKFSSIGYDNNKKRIDELSLSYDRTNQIKKHKLKKLSFTKNLKKIRNCNIFIVTVPTPITKSNKPDLKHLINATKTLSKILKKNDLIIYESTVYPGCVENICANIIEKNTNFKLNSDFFLGYSPERISPGEKQKNLKNIVKIVSGSNQTITNFIDKLYKTIIKTTYKCSSIRVAEAAKVIENTQRDLNIALMNELSILFSKLNIDTNEVLDAAKSKWNFLPFKPGLVGGHCIGVDPYYLTYKAESIGYSPKIILAGRELNDKMGSYVASVLIKKMEKKNIQIKGAKILIMGLTFKENCPDIRNSGVQSIITELNKFECNLDLQDPYVDREEIKKIYNIYPITDMSQNTYDAVIIAVAHNEFKTVKLNQIKTLCKKNHIIFDLKNLYNSDSVDLKL